MDVMSRNIPGPGIEFTPRDFEILCGLYETRLATIQHLTTLYFAGRIDAARKRIQRLKALGYIRERPRQHVYEAAILFLTKKAFQFLNECGKLAAYPQIGLSQFEKRVQVSASTLRHELSILDVKAATASAVAASGASLVEFSTWPTLFQFMAHPGQGPEVLIKPDGFIRIGVPAGEATFFLELDRSTETLERLRAKVLGYLDYYNRGGLASRFGQPRTKFKEFPFRVLFVVPSAERRNNLASILISSRPSISGFAWISTLEEVLRDPLAAIWVRPTDYKIAVANTAFDGDRRRDGRYISTPERETFVERTIRKQRLIA